MRLTCPNCGAQYEVPPEAVPAAGRDVQCSACGHTWFEQPAESRPRLIDPEFGDGPPRVEGDAEEEEDLAELRAQPRPGPVSPPMDAAAAGTAQDGLPPRSRVPPEVAGILREEAAREAQARAEETVRRTVPPVASAVLPPSAASVAPEIARPAVAPRRLRPREAGEPEVRQASSPAAPPARPPRLARQVDREIDLDRINSTLRTHADQIGAKAPQLEAPRRRRPGFGGGFWGSLAVLAILAALYVFRPQIVEAVPRAAAVLDPYARVVDQGRFWLDHEVGRLLGVTPGS